MRRPAIAGANISYTEVIPMSREEEFRLRLEIAREAVRQEKG